MAWLRRATGVIFAIAAAIGAGVVALPVAALIDPVTRHAGFCLLQFAIAAAATELAGGLDGNSLAVLVGFVRMPVITVCAIPVVTVALLGEIARVRGLYWYAGGTGCAAALAPWLIRAALHLPRAGNYNFADLRFALVFFLTGLISGCVYWLLAGRHADEKSSL